MPWKDHSGLQRRQELGRELGEQGSWGALTDRTLFSFQTSQRSCTTKPRVSPSLSLLEEDDPESLAQHPQTASSPPLGNFDLSQRSLVALEYLPFFRTYEHLLAEETLTAQPEICWDQGGGPSFRETPFPEDSDPPSGFFPYYHSKEETFPSLEPPGRLCGSFQDPPTRREVQAGCFCRMTDSRCPVSGRPQKSGEQPRDPWHPSDLCPRAQDPNRPGQSPPPAPPARSAGASGAVSHWVRAQRLEAHCRAQSLLNHLLGEWSGEGV